MKRSTRLLSVTFVLAAVLSLTTVTAQNIFVANSAYGTVSEFNSSGSLVNGAWATGLGWPYGLAFDSSGNLYVANRGNGTIEKFSPGGVDLGAFATGLNGPSGPAFDSSGNLYVANFYS